MRVSRTWSASLVVVAALVPSAAGAQLTSSLDARTEMWAPASGDGWRGLSALGGSLALDRSRWALTAEAAALTDGDRWERRGSAAALLLAPSFGPLQLSLSGNTGRRAIQNLTSDAPEPAIERMEPRRPANRWESSVQARASLGFGRWGLWSGVDARHASGADTIAERVTPVIGAWRQLGAAILSVSFAPRRFRVDGTASTVREELRTDSLWNDTLGIWEPWQHLVTFGDSGRAARSVRWDQAEARMFWSRGRIAADATLGGRVGSDFGNALWASVTGLVVLTPRVMLVAGAGSRPREATAAWERRSYATLGLRLLGPPEPEHRPPPEIRPDAADFRIDPERPGRYVLSVRVPHARRVEISGDFTQWKPIGLTRAAPDRWEAELAIAPGTHYVNVRVNGERWTAPPGLPEVEDEFNGTVGMLVVP